MLKKERCQYIITKLAENQSVNTIELAVELSVSEDSIRRDLQLLHDQGLLEKVYGGGIPVSTNMRPLRGRLNEKTLKLPTCHLSEVKPGMTSERSHILPGYFGILLSKQS